MFWVDALHTKNRPPSEAKQYVDPPGAAHGAGIVHNGLLRDRQRDADLLPKTGR